MVQIKYNAITLANVDDGRRVIWHQMELAPYRCCDEIGRAILPLTNKGINGRLHGTHTSCWWSICAVGKQSMTFSTRMSHLRRYFPLMIDLC
ncbi:hypothetical protein Ancab_026688 [Ancistrocladus abbreviatus]